MEQEQGNFTKKPNERPGRWSKIFAAPDKRLWRAVFIGESLLIVSWFFIALYTYPYLQANTKEETQLFIEVFFVLILNIAFIFLFYKIFRRVYARELDFIKEKEKNEAILLSIGDAVLEVNRDGKISVFNKAAEIITGFSADKVVGKHYQEMLKFMTEEDETLRYEFIEDALTRGIQTNLPKKAVIVKKNGEKIPITDSAAPVIDPDGNIIGAVVVFQDVTKERELEKIKLEFLSLASHQLRTPLSGIKWLIETLENEKVGPLTKEQKEYIHFINQGNERMLKLVNDLLSVIRLEGENPSISVTAFPLSDLMKEIYESLRIVAQKESLSLIYTPPKEDLEITSDKVLLKTILDIFVSNAIVYSKPKGRILFVSKREGEFVQFSVADEGIGIPKDERNNIFTKFYRASNAKAARPEGTGLGLYIAKFLTSLLSGVIQVESEENKGTTFHLIVPIHRQKVQLKQ